MLQNTDGKMTRRKRSGADGDLDITPMIDVTFLLLIFFMVTSTMQGTPDKDLPPAVSGENANAGGFLDLSILTPPAGTEDSPVMLEGDVVSLDQLAESLQQRAMGGPVSVMVYAERDVRSGFVGEVEDVLNEVQGELEYKFAVRDRR